MALDWGDVASNFIGSALLCVISIGVSYLYKVSVTLRELCFQMKLALDTMKDHESRLRVVEKPKHLKG